ncbi:DUF4221 family protein [Algoriphagus yeomjeoni]|uniref:Uncharacterized protein DUF4221 n=1 Tax=Algoriphagus yeomjeoni TaxID=291403 RepID=A0A327PZP1_9BACT|nr:DUF4221 family protein [Algoriphagus yeomjeoni]RAI95166.1 uncharacterized protein DUF4221 [Algoriphagus yeomjeoni]
MNKHFLILLLLAFASCSSEKKSEGKIENFQFSYELDTIQIDSKGEFFFLNNGLSGSTLSKSGELYTFNRPQKRLDIIDLDQLQLKDTVKFEVEGPNGIGGLGVNTINLTDLGDYYLSSFSGIRQMDSSGNLKRFINWDNEERIQDQLGIGKLISFDGIISPDGSKFYGTYSAEGRGGSSMADGLAIIDLETLELKMIEVPKLSALKEFKIELDIDGMKTTAGDSYDLLLNDSKIIISQGSINGISVYDLVKDTLVTYDYQTELLPAAKPGNFQRKVATMEAFQQASTQRSKEPLFGDFMYDSKNQLYYRISFLKDLNPEGKTEWMGILSIFNEEFNLLHEEEGLGRYLGKKFVRDGKIYRFINMEDEMAFEVLTPTFNR